MLKVTVTAFDSPVTVQDPRPVTQHSLEQSVISVQPNTTHEMNMQWGQLERIMSQLDALAAIDLCTFTVESAGVSAYAEQPENVDNPVLDYGSDGVITAVSQALTIIGNNLLGEQTIASASVVADTVAGSVLVESVNPGHDSNLYDINIIDSSSGGLALASAVVAGRTVFTIDLGGAGAETCTTVAAILNDAAEAGYGLVHATVVGVGATVVSTLQAVTPFTGGAGLGMSVTLAGLACVVVSIDISADPIITIVLATPTMTGLSLSTTAPIMLQLRSNNKPTFLTLQHA